MGTNKSRIGLMTSSLLILCYLAPTSIIAKVASDFPDVSLSVVQMIATMPCLTGLVVALLTGKLTQHFYKKHLIIFSGFCYLIGGILPFFIYNNIGFLLFAAAIMGIGFGIRLTCIASLICECFSPDQSRTLMGLQATFICGGGMIFTLLGGQLGKNEWHNTYLVYILVIAVLIIEIICLPKGYLEKKSSEKTEGLKIPGRVMFIAILGFIVYAFIQVYNSNVSVMVDIRGFGSAVQSSYAATCYTAAGAVAGIFTGPLIKKINEYVLALVCGLALVGMFVSYSSGSLLILSIGGMFCGAAFSIFTASSNYFAAAYSGEQNNSICLSMFSALANFGQAISPLLIGFLMGSISIEKRFPCTGFIFIAIIAFIIIFVSIMRKKVAER